MAHARETVAMVRAAYVYDHLPLDSAALKGGVPASTAARWKREAKTRGEDWDKLRAANLLAGEGVESIARQALADYVTQHQAVMEMIATTPDLAAMQKVNLLASLADSFAKTVAASRRVLPETDELAVSLQVLNDLADFAKSHHPQCAAAILEIVEPFGAVLVKKYG